MSVLESLFEEYQQLKSMVTELDKTNQDLQTQLNNEKLEKPSGLGLEPLKIRIAELEEQNQELLAQLTEQSTLIAEKDKEIAQLKAKLTPAIQTASTQTKISSPQTLQQQTPQEQLSNDALKLIEHSRLFDKAWYLQQNPDVAQSGMNPAEHYLLFGAFEMRNPSPNFNTASYYRQHPELLRNTLNPIVHYLRQQPQKV